MNIKQDNWTRAIQITNSRIEAQDPNFNSSLQLKILKCMGKTLELSPEERKKRKTRKLLSDFVSQTTQLKEWEISRENIEEAGKVFEPINQFQSTLEFYKRFQEYRDPKVCKFARTRWVEVKQKKADYLKKIGRVNQAKKEQIDVDKILKNWQCSSLSSRNISIDDVRQTVKKRLENLSKEELIQVEHYIRFLAFDRF